VPESDRELVGRIARGEREAMRDLYTRHGDTLFRFALSLLGDAAAAEDAVQEAMLAVWCGAGGFSGRSSVRTWLLGVCRTKAGDTLRKRAAEPAGLDLAALGASSACASGRVEFRECFAQLSAEDRELILLVYVQGLRQSEVAEALGVPVGTVKSRAFHARRKLRALLDGEAA